MIRIRAENEGDQEAIHKINERAFEGAAEANLVVALRTCGAAVVSLVAEADSRVCGHILFSPVTLDGLSWNALGLAPMAVLPEFQRQGIGSELVRAGLRACADLGYAAIVVLGHPEYYPRFGFQPASRWNLRCEYPVPDPVFMALELIPGVLSGRSGLVRYHDAFRDL